MLINRLLISAAHKSSGKTTLSVGLCAAFRAQGRIVQAFKKGPDYIDPMWLSRACGRDCHNLDFYTMQHDEMLATLQSYSEGSDLSIIEGNKGLYDGLDIEGSNSNAALAQLTQTPVILVINVQGVTRGIAPLILGYQNFEPDINIAGVILNQVRGQRHESKLRAVIEHYTDVPVVGAVYHNPDLQIDERHLGLIPSNEARQADNKVAQIGRLIAEQVELDKLARIAASAPLLPSYRFADQRQTKPHNSEPSRVRIAIARDAAFGFYYPQDFEALEAAGAKLLFFDTLQDTQLPDCDGLFIGGGFPEAKMQALEDNRLLRANIFAAVENGLPAYAECGGLMYLTRRIHWGDESHEMVGVIPADTRMYKTPQGRGYIQLTETANHLWPSLTDTKKPHIIPGHEFHYSALENSANLTFAYQVVRGTGIDGQNDGIVYKNLLANYAHLRDTSANHWAQRFVEFIRNSVSSGIE
ncbi:Protein similar to cobyrinic acid a,c-diamide synthetase clustered with dissimilatory sulfite reductase [hydrothermal vent metagenome]|uniref:Protein similar to cobyrinic acid a,c-diamide synthetase clustered with dissimilatory sulfite reductase n=1 Tax=hydrothermal vent metagenome TaxID=652676 RepID=A0A3B1B7X7_9ZZZZ